MITTSYAYYSTIYKGSLSQEDFARYYDKACYKMDNITNGLFRQADESHATEQMLSDVRKLTCNVVDPFTFPSLSVDKVMKVRNGLTDLVDKLSAVDENLNEFGDSLGIKSIKVGSVSKTFTGGGSGGSASSTTATLNGNIRDLIIEYCGKYGWGSRWV